MEGASVVGDGGEDRQQVVLNADAWVAVLKHAEPVAVRACAGVCIELTIASRDEDLWRHLCIEREVALGLPAGMAEGWLEGLRKTAGLSSYRALHTLLEETGACGGVGQWRSTSRQPAGALLVSEWTESGLMCELTRRASLAEDHTLGLRTDPVFCLRFVEEFMGPASRAVRVHKQITVFSDYVSTPRGRQAQIVFGRDGRSVDVDFGRALGQPRFPPGVPAVLHGLDAQASTEHFERLEGAGCWPGRPVRQPPELALVGAGELSGLYLARYGSHGLEVVQVCVLDEGEADSDAFDPCDVDERKPRRLVFRKVIGDPNVPSGKATFVVPLQTVPTPPYVRAAAGERDAQLGSREVLPVHRSHLAASGLPPNELVSVTGGLMQLNRIAGVWAPEWETLTFFALRPADREARMRAFASLWCATDFLLTFCAFDRARHSWRPTDNALKKRAITVNVAKDVGGFTFVGIWPPVPGDDDD